MMSLSPLSGSCLSGLPPSMRTLRSPSSSVTKHTRVNAEICDGDWPFGPEDYCNRVGTIVFSKHAETPSPKLVVVEQATPTLNYDACEAELQAVADMQASQLLFLCWLLAIVLVFEAQDEDV